MKGVVPMFPPCRIGQFIIVSAIAALVLVPPRYAAAQGKVLDGCFVGGNPVPCPGGGGGVSPMNGAAMSAAGSLGFAIGGVLGSMLRDALTAPDDGSDEAAAAA